MEAFIPTHTSEGHYKASGSSFLAFLHPIQELDSIDIVLKAYEKEHPKARHICYAWQFGETHKAHDAGEPKHSAGTPIFHVLKRHSLQDSLLVVVRYYGGTPLGIPGLIKAYETSAEEAVAANNLVPLVRGKNYSCQVSEVAISPFLQAINQHQGRILKRSYSQGHLFLLFIPDETIQIVEKALRALYPAVHLELYLATDF
jgi:uncharacterized YigZ family protein